MIGRLIKASVTDPRPAWWVPALTLSGGLAVLSWQAAMVKEWHGAMYGGLAAFIVLLIRYFGTLKGR